MSRDLLDAVIGPTPPSTVDVRAIMRQRRRVVVFRRAGIAATSVVVASALVVAGLSFASGHGRRGDTGPAAPPLQVLVVPFGTLRPDVTPQDVADALAQAVAAVAPDGQWDSQPEVVASPTEGPAAGALIGGSGTLARAGRSAPVTVAIGTIADAFVCVPNPGHGETCEVGTSPAGGTLVTRRSWEPAESCTVTAGPSVDLRGSVPVVVPNGTVTLCVPASGNPPDWTFSWGLDLALAGGLVLEVYSYASKYVDFATLGPVLNETETVTVLDDIARRITS
jgi:hypothetical protein